MTLYGKLREYIARWLQIQLGVTFEQGEFPAVNDIRVVYGQGEIRRLGIHTEAAMLLVIHTLEFCGSVAILRPTLVIEKNAGGGLTGLSSAGTNIFDAYKGTIPVPAMLLDGETSPVLVPHRFRLSRETGVEAAKGVCLKSERPTLMETWRN